MSYLEWITQKWIETGGLITQAQAAEILNCSRNAVKDFVKKGKLQAHIFDDHRPLVALSEVIKLNSERTSKVNTKS